MNHTQSELTRNENFHSHRDSGRLGDQQQKIMLAFHYPGAPSDMSLNEISERTKIRLSSVSGRVNELKALGYLEERTPRKDSVTHRTVTPVGLARAQHELFA